jgi:rare lipoprotein A
MRKIAAVLLVFTMFVITSCGSSRSAARGKVYDKKAVACYYADKFNGKKTASGEKFSNSKYTAAHKKLDFGSKVRVTNLKNNKSVVVTINDRGPFSRGRDIDLSKKAFMEITDNKTHGEITVKIEILN